MLLPAESGTFPPLCSSSLGAVVDNCVSAWDSPYVGPTPTLYTTYSYPEFHPDSPASSAVLTTVSSSSSPTPSSATTILSSNASTVAVFSSSATTSSYVDDSGNCIFYNAIAGSTCGIATTVATGFPELSAIQSSFQYHMSELSSKGYDNAVVGQASLSAAASYIGELYDVVASIASRRVNTADFDRIITILYSMAQTLFDSVKGISGCASSWIGTANNEPAWKMTFLNILEGFANVQFAVQKMLDQNTGCTWGTESKVIGYSARVYEAISELNQNFPLCPTFSNIKWLYYHHVGEQFGSADCPFTPVNLIDTISCATVMPTAVSSSSPASLTSSSPITASSSSLSFRSTTTESISMDPAWIECFLPGFFAPNECEVTTTLSTGFPNLSASQSSFQYYMNMLSSNGYGDATDGQASLKAAASCIDGVPALLTSIQSTKLGIEDFGKVISILSSMAEVLLKTVEGISEYASAWAGDANNESVWKKSFQTMLESYGYIFQVVQLILALNFECAVGASSALNEWVTRLNSAVSGLNGNFSQCPSFSTYAPLSSTTRIPGQFYVYDYCEFSSPNVVLDNCPTAVPTSIEPTIPSTSTESKSQSTSTEPATSSSSSAPSSAVTTLSPAASSVAVSSSSSTSSRFQPVFCTFFMVMVATTCGITTTVATGFPELSASQSSFQYYMNEISASGYDNTAVGQASLNAAASYIGGLQAILSDIERGSISIADFDKIITILVSMAQTVVTTVGGISGYVSSWAGTDNNELAWKNSFQEILEGLANNGQVIQRMLDLKSGCTRGVESKLSQWSILLNSAVSTLNKNFPVCPTFSSIQALHPLQDIGIEYMVDVEACPYTSTALVVTAGCATAMPTGISTSSSASATTSSSTIISKSISSYQSTTSSKTTESFTLPTQPSTSKIPTVTTTSVPTSSIRYSTSSAGTTTDPRCPKGTYIFSTCFIFTSNYLKPNSSCPPGAVFYGNKCFHGSSMALTECTQGYYYSGACYTPNAAARAVRNPLSTIYGVLAALI